MSCVFGDACPYCNREEKKIMDPDACLAEIRELSNRLLTEPYVDPEAAQELAEKINNLDEWIGNGGFLPAEWSIMQAR